MQYRERLITGPIDEPVIPIEVLYHERIMLAGAPMAMLAPDINYVYGLIAAAREYCETYTHRQFCTATWQLILDGFPRRSLDCGGDGSPGYGGDRNELWLPSLGSVISIPRPPLQSIISVTYIDMASNQQTLDPSQYIVDLYDEPGRITPAFGTFWPYTLPVINSVVIEYVAGYKPGNSTGGSTNSLNVPRTICHAIKLLAAHWYANREPINDAPTSEIPFMVTNLLSSAMWGSYVMTPGMR